MTIHEARNRIQTAVDRFPEIKRQVAEELAPEIADANREQLMKGMDADDEPIAPPYTSFIKRIKSSKGQPTDRVTLFDTGAFYEDIFSEVQGDEIVIDSKDPKNDKYSSLSPYVYCADNPVKLMDPNGEEVEYSSFSDRIITLLARIFDSDFRHKFKALKKSEETYVFNYNNNGDNSFTTNGDKLFINYSINEQSRSEGQTIFSNLRHETTHGIQFEFGEIGFKILVQS